MNAPGWRHWLGVGVVGLLAVSGAGALPPGEELVPASTRGFFSVPQVPRFRQAWDKTPFAAMLNDPAMKPYRDEVKASIDKGQAVMTWYLGLTADDLWEMGSGELVVAVIHDAGQKPAHLLILDVAGKTKEADQVLRQAGKRLTDGGARRTEQKIGDVGAMVFDLPPNLADGLIQRYYYLRKGDCLLASTTAEAAADVLGRLGSGAANTLASVKAFQETTLRAQKDLEAIHFRYFTEPLAYLEAVRILRDQKPKEKPDRLKVYKTEGFDALRGFGGAGVLATADNQVLARNYVYAPRPYRRAMQMLDFSDEPAVPPPSWIPQDAAACLSLSVKYLEAFNAYSTLFDALYGEGDTGVFEDTLTGTADPNIGPGVNLRKEVIGALRGPLWRLQLRAKAGDPNQWLVGAQVNQEKTVAAAVGRLFKGDRDIKSWNNPGQLRMWQILPPMKDRRGREVKYWGLPPSTIAVAWQHLLVAETPELLLRPRATDMANAQEYNDMMMLLDKLGGNTAFLRGMLRNEDQLADALAELRAGKGQPEGNLTQFLRAVLVPHARPNDQAKILEMLPAFDKLGPQSWGESGLHGVNREDGWLLLLVAPKKKK